jgi:hypothetical protein
MLNFLLLALRIARANEISFSVVAPAVTGQIPNRGSSCAVRMVKKFFDHAKVIRQKSEETTNGETF